MCDFMVLTINIGNPTPTTYILPTIRPWQLVNNPFNSCITEQNKILTQQE